MTINITQKHIENGVVSRVDCCPIALAIKEAIPGIECYVLKDRITICPQTVNVQTVNLPPAAVRFISRFDREENVEPLCFDIDYSPLEWIDPQ